jgi:hypothetical protein
MKLIFALALVLARSQPVDPTEDAAAESPAPSVDGATLFGQGHYVEAAEAFALEYETTRDPALLFGRAMALQRAGNCWAAIDAFEQFIETSPPESDVAEARRQIEGCNRVLGVQPPRSEPTTELPPPSPSPELGDGDRDQPAWYRDRLGGALVGVGVPVMFGGIGLYGASFAVAENVARDTETAYEDRRVRVRAMAISGLTLLGVGAAVAIAGAVRYAMVRRSRTAAIDARGIARNVATLSWRF